MRSSERESRFEQLLKAFEKDFKELVFEVFGRAGIPSLYSGRNQEPMAKRLSMLEAEVAKLRAMKCSCPQTR